VDGTAILKLGFGRKYEQATNRGAYLTRIWILPDRLEFSLTTSRHQLRVVNSDIFSKENLRVNGQSGMAIHHNSSQLTTPFD